MIKEAIVNSWSAIKGSFVASGSAIKQAFVATWNGAKAALVAAYKAVTGSEALRDITVILSLGIIIIFLCGVYVVSLG